MHELESQELVKSKYLEVESRCIEIESNYVDLRKTLRFILGSINLWRWLGYGLLVLIFLDVIDILIPPKFMDPVWEFKIMEILVGRIPLSLIGFMLVFSGRFYNRHRRERALLKFLSLLTLLLGLVFITLVPLGIADAIRLNNLSLTQVNTQYNQQKSQIEQIQKQITQAKPEEVENYLKRQGKILEGKNPQGLKSQILSNLDLTKQKIKLAADQARSYQRLNILKRSIKMNLGALIAGILYIGIWKLTSWVRISS